ncbi:hypothetical protein R5R35_007943 [Gryllus longicercus]
MESTESSPLRANRPKKWRNMVAYWLLGLCNNYGYVVMLSAAHDVLEKTDHSASDDIPQRNSTERLCNTMSTGTILLADILPSLFVKVIAPFLPFFVHIRVLIVILLSCAGFLLVAFTTAPWMAILGVVSTSFASGLGELTFLAYSHKFERSSISMWSSGTGGAGVFGAGSYAGLTALGLSSKSSLLLMLIVPVIMGLSFWLLLKHPGRISCCSDDGSLIIQNEDSPTNIVEADESVQDSNDQSVIHSFYRKLCDIPPLFRYMIPVGLVYLFEYFINQGLFELIYFEGLSIDHKEQYRWYQLDYQIGVFISRSSASFFTLKKIWLMAVFQFLNVIIFTFEAIYFYIPNIWIVFALILWEGTLGGAAYVNTYYRIANEVAPEKKEFSLSITTLADAIGIGLAGAISIPVHNIICKMPAPTRL